MMVEGGQDQLLGGGDARLEGAGRDMRTEINGGSGKDGNYEVGTGKLRIWPIISISATLKS